MPHAVAGAYNVMFEACQEAPREKQDESIGIINPKPQTVL